MSSVKRRKVDTDVPSGLKKKSKHSKVQEKQPSPESASSPEPELAKEDAVEDGEKEEEVTKSFKDLVSLVPEDTERRTDLTRVSSTLYAMRVQLLGTRTPPQSRPNRYPSPSKDET